MIEINLLPPEHRPVERTPLPRLLAILGGVLLVAAGAVGLAFLALVGVPRAAARRNNQRREMEAEKAKAEEVQRLEAQLKAFEARETVLTALFRERICWSRILDRLAEARKTNKDVILTALELKKTSTPRPGGKGTESRQLYIKGYVPAWEGASSDLRKNILDFIETLRKDKKFADEFEGEPVYRGDRFIEKFGPASTGTKPNPLIPKSGLEFEVAFDFKPTAPPPAPPPPPPAPTPPAKH